MDLPELWVPVVVVLTTFAVAVLSGFVPVVNTELYLIGVAALAPLGAVPVLVLSATLGQMAAKSAMYLVGRGALTLPFLRRQQRLSRVQQQLRDRSDRVSLFVFVSASLGFPPFYIVSVACGMLEVAFSAFFTAGLLGRLVRFAFFASLPQLGKELLA
ncbi:MAG: VTT domain-containing protein [Gemmatimonadetes bacterium]|nr:VTT domain-containing protein [Gemmatimonadota bacterium]